MKRIAVVTTTRAEFGLLLPVIKELRKYENDVLKVDLIVSGTHLSQQYGCTINEIIDSGVRIDYGIKIPLKATCASDISNNQAEILIKFTNIFSENCYNAIVLLGDRYEMLAVAIAARNMQIPIFHLCGGDTTEGAMDEWIRHAITKMSYLHFVTNRESYNRVIQLGENPNRVFDYGSTSIDNVLNHANLSEKDILEDLGIATEKYAICTYHPVTMGETAIEWQIENFVAAIKQFPMIEFIVTKSNSDLGGEKINELLARAELEIQNLHVVSSLGIERYLALMRHALFVLGNSSSGIVETPAFGVPTVNIGDRQKGRLRAESIIDCGEDTKSIVNAIYCALNEEFCKKCHQCKNPYGDGKAAVRIAKKIVEVILDWKIDLKKKFYDINV